MATKSPTQIIEYVDFWFPTNYRGEITAARQRAALFDLVLLTGTTAVIDIGLNVPPDIEEDAAYVIGPTPTGLWTGQNNKIAYAVNGEWLFYPPPPIAIGFDYDGLQVWVTTTDTEYTWTGTAWLPISSGGDTVLSVFGRTGIVVAVSGDYSASLITNDSAVPGATVDLALNALLALSGTVSDGNYGDITVSSGGSVWTINNSVVTLTKIQDIASNRILGRTTAGPGIIEQLSTAGVTAMLDLFTSGLQGLTPASGGGTVNFLRADGAWGLPPGDGHVNDGNYGDIVVSGGGLVWTIATVNANVGSFGSTSMTLAITANAKGQITAISATSISITASQVTDFTEAAQDAIGVMVGASLIYVDATPLLARAALTGDISAPQDSNATTLATVNAGPGTFGDATHVAQITVNAKGLATVVANVAIAGTPPADGDYGDITVSGSGLIWTIDAGVVTFAKMQNIATDSLIGRDTAGTGVPENILLNATLSMDGSGNLRRAALTGDITAPVGSNATTLATVNANVGTFGSVTQTVTFTVNGKGLITAASQANIAIPSTQVTDFTEAAQDATGAMVGVSLIYVDATPLLARAALTGDVTAPQDSNATTIANDAVTFAKMQNIVTDSLIGRDTAGTGDPENITLNATLSMDGAGALRRAALTGDITAPVGSNATTLATVNANVGTFGDATHVAQITANGKGLVTAVTNVSIAGVPPADGDYGDITVSGSGLVWTIDADVVTFAKMQNIVTDSLIGRDTAGTGDPENITLNATLSMTGAGVLQRAALSGDISASAGSNVTAIGANKVTSAMLRQGVARSVIGVTGNATADEADIQGATDQVLRVNGAGTALAFGAIDLSKSAAAGGVLQAASFPALTGDITTVAGALATTLATVNVNVGTFGSVTKTVTFTVNGKGLITAASQADIAIPSTQVTDFTEAAQDAVGAMVDATLVYVDATPLLTRAALTGDVTAPQASNATTIAANAVTNTQLADMATQTIKGRTTAGTGDPEDLTATQAGAIIGSSGPWVLKTGDTMTGTLNLPAGTAALPALVWDGDTDTGFWHDTADFINFSAGGVQRWSIANSIRNTAAAVVVGGAGNPRLAVHGAGGTQSAIAAGAWVNTTGNASFYFAKSRSATIGTPGVALLTNDNLGQIFYYGDDGSATLVIGGSYNLLATENWAVGAHGSRFQINTVPIGSATQQSTLEISSAALTYNSQDVFDANTLLQLRVTSIAGAFTGAGGKVGYFNNLGGGASAVVHDGTNYRRASDGGYATITSNADATLTYISNSDFLQHTGTLTAIRTLTLSTTGAVAGAFFTVYRTGAGNFALNVAGAITASLFIGQFVTFRFDGAAWQQTDFGSVAPTEVIRKLKTSNENRNNTAALASDATLQFPMAASVNYRFVLRAFYDTLAAADLKWRTTGPAGATAIRIKRSDIAPAATALENIAVDVAYSAADIVALTAGTTGGYIEMDGIVQNGATAGTFALQWAQNTATVGNSTILAGSWLEYQAIA